MAYVQRGRHSKFYCIRPYYAERTGSRPITEVKQRRAQSVLGWVTTLEYWVPYAFYQKEVRAWLMYYVVVIPSYIVFDHITLSAPVLVRSPKISNVEPSQYLDGSTLEYWVPYAFYPFQKKFVRGLCTTWSSFQVLVYTTISR